MNTQLTDSLGGFASSVNSLIPVTSILIVISIAIGTAFSIYIVSWGAKKIIHVVIGALSGHLDLETYAYRHQNSFVADYIVKKHNYLSWDDYEEAQTYGYKSAKDYYDDDINYKLYGRFDNKARQKSWDDYNDYLNRDDDDYERDEITHPHLTQYDIDEIKKDYPDGYDDLPF